MPPDVAAPSESDEAAELFALVADAVADRRPPSRLLAHLHAFDAAGDADAAARGVALFESLHYRLPAFADDDLPLVASRLYARAGQPDVALLLAGLAVQLRPEHEPARAALSRARAALPAPADPDIAARAAAIVQEGYPPHFLLLALEALDGEAGRAASALLFEAVWPRVRPMTEYWIYHRMSQVYAGLGRDAAAVLFATLAIQIEPFDRASNVPHLVLLQHFRAAGRLRDAAELLVRRAAACPDPVLLREPEATALRKTAGTLILSPPPAGRRDRALLPSTIRPGRPWRVYGSGVPASLEQLRHDLTRDAITMSEIQDAEVLIDHGAVAVFGPDGVPHLDLSLRCFPALLRRTLAGHADEIETDAAVVISDVRPEPNLCHFLLDHATRLDLYRRAGVEIGGVTVIGPELQHEYQRATAERMGVRGYIPVTRRVRLRVGRLWVSSTCHTTRHPAHWASPWAIEAVRARFDLVPRRPARRLLVSRRDSPWRRFVNEAQLADFLQPLGFEVIVPGSLSFAEQIAAFRDATHIVAPHGAGLANILWCAPGTHVLEVFHPHYGTWAYGMIKDALGLDYATLVARDGLSDAPEFNDPALPREQTHMHSSRDMWVDPDELERWLIDSEAL